jgi:hypothetical protein
VRVLRQLHDDVAGYFNAPFAWVPQCATLSSCMEKVRTKIHIAVMRIRGGLIGERKISAPS